MSSDFSFRCLSGFEGRLVSPKAKLLAYLPFFVIAAAMVVAAYHIAFYW